MYKNQILSVKRTLSHWDRMIKWSSKQGSRIRVNKDKMLDVLGENWYGKHCSLCLLVDNKCLNCVLRKRYGSCDNKISDNMWVDVDKCKTWGTWVRNAKLFRKQIASLLKKGKNEQK